MSSQLLRFSIYALVAFSVVNTVGAGYWLLIPNSHSSLTSLGSSVNGTATNSQPSVPLIIVSQTPALAAGGWGLVAIACLWYQRTTSIWRKMGFDSDVFRLLMRARGGPTRVRLLQSLTEPKNRLELAHELGYDWNVIDRHIRILLEYGIIEESSVYGNVKLYHPTKTGETLLRLIEELQAAEKISQKSHSVVGRQEPLQTQQGA